MGKQYKALILDMDGTLLNSKQMVRESIGALAAEYGIQLTEEQHQTAFGCASDEFMEKLGLPDPAVASDRWREIMVDMLDKVVLYDGVDQVLAAPIRRGVVTSQTREELTTNTALHQFDGLFEFTVTVEETPYQKPHPRPLLYCLEQMGLAPEEALYVGDSSYDHDCAHAAGVDFGLATWGAHDPGAFSHVAYRFKTPPEMLEYIAVCANISRKGR